MNAERQQRITEYRRRQPLQELERKWKKARGRHSNMYWATEWLDLAAVRAREMVRGLRL